MGEISMKKLLLAAVAAAFALPAAANAAIINAPVPTANYITVGGLDWAWAAPCAFSAPTCGAVDLSYQGGQGWRIPTLSEFLARPTVADFGGKCASNWFSLVHSHCDFGDPEYDGGVNGAGQPMGYLYDFGYGITTNGTSSVADTWLVRGGNGGGVPEPATWALLIAGFGMVGGAMRRRQSVRVTYA
jgi:hypothetical protein